MSENERVHVPWTEAQVDALNAYQRAGKFHPFTCGNDSTHRVLLATPRGWMCQDCPYTQAWAHGFMAETRP